MGENGAGVIAVGLHLRLEAVDAVEAAVAADVGDEVDGDLAAVEVLIEVEQKHLQHRCPVVEGRPRAEIGCRRMGLAIDQHAHRVNAVGERRSGRSAMFAVGKPRPVPRLAPPITVPITRHQ